LQREKFEKTANERQITKMLPAAPTPNFPEL